VGGFNPPKWRIFSEPCGAGASLRFIKKRFWQSEKGFGQQLVEV
jgi:hypothetical protein